MQSAKSQSQSDRTRNPRTSQFALLISLVVLVTLSFVFWVAGRMKAQARSDLGETISTVLRTTQGALHLWRLDLEGDIDATSRLPRLRELTQDQLHRGDDSKFSSRAREVNRILRTWMGTHGYVGYDILVRGPSGRLNTLFGKQMNRRDLTPQVERVIDQALAGRFTLSQPFVSADPLWIQPDLLHQVIMIAAHPIRDESGRTIAALTFSVDAFGAFTKFTQLGRIGSSGETYAVDRLGQMVTQSRFVSQLEKVGIVPAGDTDSSLIELRDPGGNMVVGFRPNQPRSAMPLTEMAKSLLSGEDGMNLDGYRDYRGVTVVGAWGWDKDLGLGFATEMDKTEAYRSYRALDQMIWLIFGIILLSTAVIVLLREARGRVVIANLALEQTNRARKELLATASHDLKNPLASLLLTNEILLKTLPQNFDFTDKRRKLLEQSRRAAERMGRLIADLLDTAKIEAGKMVVYPTKCDGEAFLSGIIELIEPLATNKSIHIVKDIPGRLPALWADPDRLSQVFSNLLGNAVKFTPSGGAITVRARVSEDWVEFSVSDTGPGISKEDLPHVFERYWQSRNTAKAGAGLGLAITHEFVTAHGGKLWVESELGRGSTFYFTVPRAKAAVT